MGKLLIKINIVQTQLWEKLIHKLISCFQKQHDFSRLIFFWGGGGRVEEPIKCLKIIYFATTQLHVSALANVPFIRSFTNEQSILTCRGRQ